MPQRFLRPGLRDSTAWNACSWAAQSLYVRLLTLVDDYGRYDARIDILKGHCFPLRNDINPQETAALRSELRAWGLIEVYEKDGHEFLQITKWQERARGKSRWPDPVDSKPLRNPAESCGILPPSPSPSPSPAPSDARGDARKDELKAESEPPPRQKADDWPTLDAVIFEAGMHGIPRHVAEAWWGERDGVGGVSRGGQPITKWRSHLGAYAVKWRENESKRRNAGSSSRPGTDRNAGTTNADSHDQYRGVGRVV